MIKKSIKRVLSNTDSNFKTSLYKRGSKLLENWYGSNFLNATQRIINPAIVKLKYGLGMKDNGLLKLHLGCGNRHIDDYINIDLRKTGATDLVCDIRKLPYPNNSVRLIETYHVIEHLPRHDLPKALKEWRRLLIPSGRLIIECPDFDELVSRYLDGDEKQLDGIFALQRFPGDYHYWGYNIERLRRMLERYGFTNVESKPPQDYHVNEWPCIRVECVKAKEEVSSMPRSQKNGNLAFTGERVVEGTTPQRIWSDHVARYEFAANYVKDKKVLDIACGTGFGSKILQEKGATGVFGVDLSKEAIGFANEKYGGNRLEFMIGDILKIDFPDDLFDVIVSFETIEHVKQHEKVLWELRRVLKPSGLLIISSPNRTLTSPGKSIIDSPDNVFHVVEYSCDEFVRILEKYFEVNGLYGQRAINKVLLLPFLERILRKYLSQLYSPEAGSPLVAKCRPMLKYRYIIASCINSNK
jgi:ubiquinone/menaquinone biosynthesis C-methylase UbiE